MKENSKIVVDIHAVQTLPPNCINRDDAGSPKSAFFGGVRRVRVSSQSWKKAMRSFFKEELDLNKSGIRTYYTASNVADRIVRIDSTISYDNAIKLAEKSLVSANVIKADSSKKSKGGKPKNDALTFFSENQLENLAEKIVENPALVSDKRMIQQILKSDQSYDLALFGRMVASAADLKVDAACQVAHAFGVDPLELEYDFFISIDDAQDEEEDHAGGSHIGFNEFNSSTVYRFASVSESLLTKNLGSSKAAIDATVQFVRAFYESIPTGRQNTYAANSLPAAIIVTVREGRSIDYSNAFVEPIEEGNIHKVAAEHLKNYITDVDSNSSKPAMKTFVVCFSEFKEELSKVGDIYTLNDMFSALEEYLEETLPVVEQVPVVPEDSVEDSSAELNVTEATEHVSIDATVSETLEEVSSENIVKEPHVLVEETDVEEDSAVYSDEDN